MYGITVNDESLVLVSKLANEPIVNCYLQPVSYENFVSKSVVINNSSVITTRQIESIYIVC